MKLYTGKGDDGGTVRPGGARIRKTDPMCEACGTIDELDAHLGLALAEATDRGQAEVAEALAPLQAELLAVGAVVASAGTEVQPHVTLDPASMTRMERRIDAVCAKLPDLKEFILPGGCKLACRLHVTRAVCRRAERRIVALADADVPLPPAVVPYLNRLGDLLFALARLANHQAGLGDAAWHG